MARAGSSGVAVRRLACSRVRLREARIVGLGDGCCTSWASAMNEGWPKVVARLQEIRKALGPEPRPGPLPPIVWKEVNGTARPFCC